jgi:hypothetical protein
MALILGGFIFTDYAIPEKVPQGGEHNLVVHKLIGGQRVVDAMGPDDSDISWHGRFQGPAALGNTLALDGLRKAGTQVPLIVDSQFYTVAVQKFEWDYERFYQILYRITCLVVTGSTGGAFAAATSLDTLVAGDMAAAGALVAAFTAGR